MDDSREFIGCRLEFPEGLLPFLLQIAMPLPRIHAGSHLGMGLV